MQDLNDALLALINRYEVELGPLAEEDLDRRPADGGWTARETVGHLIVAVELYNEKLTALLARAPAQTATSGKPRKPTLVGRFLIRFLSKEGAEKKDVGAPKVFRPDPTGRVYTVAELIDVHRMLHENACAVDERGLLGARIATPVSGLLKLRARDVVEVQVLHGRRHLEQATRAAGPRA